MLIVAATFLGCGDSSDETTTVTEPAVTRTAEPTTTTTTGTTTTTTGDGTTTTTTGDGTTTTTTGEDVSGNCDEAEHANDPECR
jgi:hypothetical protein